MTFDFGSTAGARERGKASDGVTELRLRYCTVGRSTAQHSTGTAPQCAALRHMQLLSATRQPGNQATTCPVDLPCRFARQKRALQLGHFRLCRTDELLESSKVQYSTVQYCRQNAPSDSSSLAINNSLLPTALRPSPSRALSRLPALDRVVCFPHNHTL